jgi:hypothetical protein
MSQSKTVFVVAMSVLMAAMEAIPNLHWAIRFWHLQVAAKGAAPRRLLPAAPQEVVDRQTALLK